jgi:putative sigma-54 modulation protein
MNITISGKHMEITDAIKSYVNEKCSKLPRYFNSTTEVEVVIEGNDGGHQSVEIIARSEHTPTSVAKESGEDIYACFDLALHKLERQLRRKKEKQRNNKHISGAEPVDELEG